jgi:glyoxylase-like metal-dependent hydrolase (beta-lactamase superfamily II)
MKLTDKIHLLQIDFEITLSSEKKIPRFVNVILILGNRITLIDTGVKGSEKIIFEYIKGQNRDYSEIDTVILSHSHPDHIGSVATIKELTNCKVLSHELEKDWIEDIDLQNKQRPVPGFYNLVDKSVIVDGLISDKQRMSIEDGLSIRFIKSAGHSKGLLNILFEEDKILFTADSIPLKNDIPNYDNYSDLMLSLEEIKKNTGFITLLTSWTPPLNDKNEIEKLIE